MFVDGNGGYDVAAATAIAQRFAESGVTWFEQPVDHNDLAGTRRVREHAPPGVEISSGEYITDTSRAAAVAGAVVRKPLSSHCGPMLNSTSPRRRFGCVTWNTLMITYALRSCCSTDVSSR
ncbi:MAG: hypothetical protein M3169_13105 [Candidatus Eremiobacteraeota bacterium]|nr:hypothetical protein [Candidatus Eremiobacteraeota bacterium]